MPLTFTRQQLRRLDDWAVQRYGIPSLVLMENAGRGCVDHLCAAGIQGPVAILCGGGNNGGDGLVMARHLDLRGYQVRVGMFAPLDKLSTDCAANFRIIEAAEIRCELFSTDTIASLPGWLDDADWIVDSLLGTGAAGNPRPPLDEVIRHVNRASARRLAVDVPSGLDCDRGQPAAPTVRADLTCTFVARKPGFDAAAAQDYLGQVEVLDIGAPRRLIEQIRDARVSQE